MRRWSKGRTIGRGSSATVSLASASLTGELFAVKSAELSRSSLLQKEKRILSALSSPNIISYLASDITTSNDGTFYYNILMEYAPHGSLSDRIQAHGGHLDELSIRSHTHGILSGLAYLHARHIAHCDIKCRNVLIGSDGRTKIADFGCSRLLDEEDFETQKTVMGTPMFMSPEVARGEEQGPAADVWALGCSVIEMATGRSPWVGPVEAVLHRIAFSSEVPEIPSWLSEEGIDFLQNCLRRDPKERWTADRLICHPFVAIKSLKSSLDWVSPKSTLDHELWSCSEEDDDTDKFEGCRWSDSAAERLRQLMGDGESSHPSWSWDEESWITIRRNPSELSSNLEKESKEILILSEETSKNSDHLFEDLFSTDSATSNERLYIDIVWQDTEGGSNEGSSSCMFTRDKHDIATMSSSRGFCFQFVDGSLFRNDKLLGNWCEIEFDPLAPCCTMTRLPIVSNGSVSIIC